MPVATPKARETKEIIIPSPEFVKYEVTIKGVTPLLCHRWREEDKETLAEKGKEAPKKQKPPRNPQKEAMESLYITAKGDYYFPAAGIKKSLVTAGNRFAGEYKTHLNGVISILNPFPLIEGDEPVIHESMVRTSGMTRAPMARYRPQFTEWAIRVPIRFDERFITLERVLNLFKLAGFSVGLGDWRPECSGDFGQFEIGEVRPLQ